MATGVPVTISWIPEDDLLLKNAVEAGASLEALAKGAVQFSRRFSFQELQDRWNSLLYDPDISAQASTRMFELELSGFNPSLRNGKCETSKRNMEVSEKRKIESVRKQYYSMRKRFRSELFNTNDLGFLDELNLHDSNVHVDDFQRFHGEPPNSTCGSGSVILSHFDFQEPEIQILRSAFAKPARDSSIISGAVGNHNAYLTGCSNAHGDKYLDRALRTYGFSEVSTSYGQKGMTIDPDVKPGLSSFSKGNAVNFNDHSGIHEPFLPKSLEMQRLSDFDSKKDNPQNAIRGSRQEHHLSPPSDDSSFHTIGFSSAQPNLPLWDPVDKFSAHSIPVILKQGDGVQDANEMLTNDGEGNDSFVYDGVHDGPMLGVSEGDFGYLPDSLLNLSNEDDVLLADADGKATTEKSCTDNVDSVLPSSPTAASEDAVNNLEPEALIVPDTCLANQYANLEKSVANATSIHSDHPNVHNAEVHELLGSFLAVDSHALGDGKIICTLNTEDPEIPCNDDIFLLIHPSASFASCASQPNPANSMEIASSGIQEHFEPGMSQEHFEPGMKVIMDTKDVGKSSKWSQKSGTSILPETLSPHSLAGSKIIMISKNILAKVVNKTTGDLSHTGLSFTNASVSANGMLNDDISSHQFKARKASITLPGAQNAIEGSLNVDISEPMVNPSTSDQEECQSDDDVPYFSDIEAMILEMDLDPDYQDKDAQRKKLVSKYQSEDTRRSIIRLDQCARSCLQRAMTLLGAFAIFYGRHLRHYIKKTEVILGRSTDDAEVDIDLRKEGRANKISRQQAIVKMEANGSFYLKNLGKSLISINGRSVAKGQLICLSSSCLIEIRGMGFVFETNQKFIQHYMNMSQKNKGKNSKFEWLPDEET